MNNTPAYHRMVKQFQARQRIEAALLAGRPRLEIAEWAGIGYTTICKIARELGIPNSGWRRVHKPTPEQATKAIERHGSLAKAAKALGVSPQTVRVALRANGETKNNSPRL